MRDEKNKRFGKALLALTLALVLLLTSVEGAVEVFAEEGLKPIDSTKGISVEKPEPKAPITEDAKAKEEKASPVIENDAKGEEAELELGGEIVGNPVGDGQIDAPTINDVFIGDKTISGKNLHRGKIGGKNARGTVHVTLKDKKGSIKDEVSVTPKSGTTWKVKLSEGVEVAEGDTVTAYQEFDRKQSPVTEPVGAKLSLADQNKDKLNMPTGEILIEQTSSNIVNEDEQAEAVKMLKDANPEISGDIKSVKFSINGINHAYYEVTYTDGSTSGKVEATNLQIKQVTEYSRGAKLDSITIVDNVIEGQLEGEGPFEGIKVQLILKVKKEKSGDFCTDKGCKIDKDSSDPVDAVVDGTTGKFTYTIPNPDLKLDQVVGVTVKEKNKFKSCSKTTVQPAKVGKTNVKDPRKLTAEDKKAIDAAIRKAYTVDGKSKLPKGNPDRDGVPAVIQIDDSGNAKIFSPNDVKGDWDPNNNYKFVPEKNEDGSYKLNDGAQPKIEIPAKDLLKNIKPDVPTFSLSEDKKSITITPNKVDTDAEKIAVNYEDPQGNKKEAVAVKTVDNSGTEPIITWKVEKGDITVDSKTGVVTLPVDKVKCGENVTATVTDKGGIADDDKEALTSDQAEFKVTKAILVEALGGLDPVVLKKWVGDDIDWKQGVKAKDSKNKAEVDKLLGEEKTSFNDENSRGTTAEGDFEGKIKITFDDKSELVVEKQMLYVSNHVTSMDRKDKVPTDDIDVQLKLGEGVKVEDKDPNSGKVTKTTKGDKDNPVLYKEYKVKPGTDISTYKHPTLQKTIFELIDEKADEGYPDPVWKDSKGGTNFVATTKNRLYVKYWGGSLARVSLFI